MLPLADRTTTPAATQTAVIVPIPAAEPVVDVHRQRFDRAAGWGVPAHVTVLYPFVAPDEVEDALVPLVAAVGSVPAFDCSFGSTAWFGRDVLQPEPPEPREPFARLTQAVWTAFPDCPPYGGEDDGSAPHLTLGERAVAEERGSGLVALEHAEEQVRAALPVRQTVDHALLIAGSPAPRTWRTLHRLPLG